jgi:mRNA-degrading endonuclease RelE of RelBE toxin-antitoxin system
MTIEQQVLEKLRDLPPDKQKEVLDFVDFLKEKNSPKKPRRSLLGLWADLNTHITEEDIAQARREMWGNFPRDIKL